MVGVLLFEKYKDCIMSVETVPTTVSTAYKRNAIKADTIGLAGVSSRNNSSSLGGRLRCAFTAAMWFPPKIQWHLIKPIPEVISLKYESYTNNILNFQIKNVKVLLRKSK